MMRTTRTRRFIRDLENRGHQKATKLPLRLTARPPQRVGAEFFAHPIDGAGERPIALGLTRAGRLRLEQCKLGLRTGTLELRQGDADEPRRDAARRAQAL